VRNLTLALGSALGLVVGLPVREYVKARAAIRLGDPSPRMYGRAELLSKAMVDPLGSVIVPAILVFLVATGQGLAVFGWAKPMPLHPDSMPDRDRGIVLLALAGPAATLVLSIAGALALRVAFGVSEALWLLAFGFLWTNLVLTALHLLPVPGLDGSLWLRRFLQGRARLVYVSLDQYLPLFMILLLFFLSFVLSPFIGAFGEVVCRGVAGAACDPSNLG
jgi:Zn-dependent protease